MEILTQFFINIENNIHQIITWVFNIIHTTIDCFDAMIDQWLIVDDIEEDNNRKIGFK